jgi:hypothetical protein
VDLNDERNALISRSRILEVTLSPPISTTFVTFLMDVMTKVWTNKMKSDV